MPTVSELREHVMRVSSLNTSDTTEQTLVLRWLNDAYQRALALTGVESAAEITVAMADGTDTLVTADYNPDTTLGVAGVKAVFLNSADGAANGRQLQRVSQIELQRMRATNATPGTDGPYYFAVRGNGDISLYPPMNGVNRMTVEMELQPLELIVSGTPTATQELTPSMVPPFLHYELLANHAIARAFEYRGLQEKAGYFRDLSNGSVADLRGWLSEQGGIQGPRVKVLRGRSYGVGLMPDQRW